MSQPESPDRPAIRGRLQDKIAIVTGAGTGIGEAIAHKFFREGARVPDALREQPEGELELAHSHDGQWR